MHEKKGKAWSAGLVAICSTHPSTEHLETVADCSVRNHTQSRMAVYSPSSSWNEVPVRSYGLANAILPFHLSSGSGRNQQVQAFRCLRLGFAKTPSPKSSIPPRSRRADHGARSVSSETANQTKPYTKVGAESTGPIPPDQLLQVVENAAKAGAQIVMDAVNKPRNIAYKGLTDLVTDTDKASEAAILEVVRKNFSDHLILGEEGGLIGENSSDYLWCIDPLAILYEKRDVALKLKCTRLGSDPSFYHDGTTNFAHCYPSFAVSVAVLFRGKPAAAAVVEFVGGHMCWSTRTFSATAGGGSFCNSEKVHVSQTERVEQSLLVTGFGYEHDDAWATNMGLFKKFTNSSRGVRRLGAAAVDMCHVALGIVEAYWEYSLKPWDMAAGVLIVEEAGGTVTRMDGGSFCVFDRSLFVSNGLLHAKLLDSIGTATDDLKNKGIDLSLWYKPEHYRTEF